MNTVRVHQEQAGPDAHGTWLVSFADLLTLLLCAFLMMFSYTWEESSRVPKVSNFDGGNSQTESHGIVIAQSSSESLKTKALEHGIEIRLSREDFKDDGKTLRGKTAADIKSIVISDRYANAEVTLKVCSSGSTPVNASEKQELLLRLGSQLIDAGVTAQRLRYAVYGYECTGAESTTSAVVIFERVAHG